MPQYNRAELGRMATESGFVRARLYVSAGNTDLFKIAAVSPEQIISDTTRVII